MTKNRIDLRRMSAEQLARHMDRKLANKDSTGIMGPFIISQDIFSLRGFKTYKNAGKLQLPVYVQATQTLYGQQAETRIIADKYLLSAFHPDVRNGSLDVLDALGESTIVHLIERTSGKFEEDTVPYGNEEIITFGTTTAEPTLQVINEHIARFFRLYSRDRELGRRTPSMNDISRSFIPTGY